MQTFQQDNARPHTARICQQFLQTQNYAVLPWPPYSPDLSPIEHIWDVLGQRAEPRTTSKCLSAGVECHPAGHNSKMHTINAKTDTGLHSSGWWSYPLLNFSGFFLFCKRFFVNMRYQWRLHWELCTIYGRIKTTKINKTGIMHVCDFWKWGLGSVSFNNVLNIQRIILKLDTYMDNKSI